MGIIVAFCIIAIIILILMIREEFVELRYCLGAIVALLIIGSAILSFYEGKELVPDIQYVPAEYVAENDNSTYFGTETGNIFYVDRIPLINRNVPYLLGMDTNGTPDVTDDIILTVWSLCE